ncbi:hypothetical protein P9K38_21110 [Pseudomonas sp. 905_Psudmo1]|uniref:hypothetical protein n=1 Tax=Pseudomonas aeruginosa TaxID=287 RepID=UPI000FC406F7|nr:MULTISPECIES: hypothetical protein [Pseudomonas]RUF04462.1 hypothetical protein IPC1134_15920 [Pseudomonas aeruginosa]WFS17917.1 hypothetical protein P9K38_21110 [Pseudomonas sp. 905_Psudmo1]
MKYLKAVLMSAMLFPLAPTIASAEPPDYSKWANKELKKNGFTDATLVETGYPKNFTFCQKGSTTLWRYDVMSPIHLKALAEGKTIKPLTKQDRTVAVEENSAACKLKG